jgi:hypothetical protein
MPPDARVIVFNPGDSADGASFMGLSGSADGSMP